MGASKFICMLKYIVAKRVATTLLLLIIFSSVKGQIIRPKLSLGLTNYSYLHENVLGSIHENTFTKSIITAPTIGLKLDFPKYHFGIESNYYQAAATTVLTDRYLLYGKHYFDVGIYGSYNGFSVAAFYNHINFRNYKYFGFGDIMDLAYEQGVGLGIGYTKGSYDFSLRLERAWEWNPSNTRFPLSTRVEIFCLRLLRNFDLIELSKEESTQLEGLDNEFFNLQFGLIGSGNGLHGLVGSMTYAKLAPSIGVEIKYKEFGVYLRRSMWVNLDLELSEAGKFSSVNNQIGLSYDLDLVGLYGFNIGVHHVWNYTRGQQHLNLLEDPLGEELELEEFVSYFPQNQGLGLAVSYELNRHLEFLLISDFYYKAAARLGKGFNSESLRLGLLYNLR